MQVSLIHLLCIPVIVSGLGIRFHKIKRLAELERLGAPEKIQQNGMGRKDNSSELYLEQPLDHFDPLIQTTYMQRYWVNETHWKNKTGPVFLYIGGEGPLGPNAVERGEHVDLAAKYGALVFAVEHRYYGKSINKDGLKLENMQYLSSQQALADLANFHTHVSKEYNLTEKNTWICYGGSYPGNLAAWFRIKYPHLVYAAIASSAPVHATVNFEGYNNVVAHSLSDPLVNGSKQCASNIKAAFAKVDDMLANRQNEQLAKDFKSCNDFYEEQDIFSFVSGLADMFMGTVQYNIESQNGPNVSSVCTHMTNSSNEPYENLKTLLTGHDELMAKYLGEKQENCTTFSWENDLKMIKNTTVDYESSTRQWIYQTCSQFGYYQTCDSGTPCVFSRHMTLEKNLRTCSEAFAIYKEDVFKRVEFSNSYYGSNEPRGTRIVFVNGSVDPWHALGVLKDIGDSEIAIYIPGTAHCANMGSASPRDPPALVEAKKMIDAHVGKFLAQAIEERKSDDLVLRFKPKIA